MIILESRRRPNKAYRLWTLTGIPIGYKKGIELRTYDGHHIGNFHGTEVYAPSGQYLGEMRYGRLVTIVKKYEKKRKSFRANRKLHTIDKPDRKPSKLKIKWGGEFLPFR